MGEALKSKSSFGKGLSRSYAYKWIGEHYPGTSVSAVRRAVTKSLAEGYIKHGKTNARFLLTDEGKAKFFPKPKKKKTAKKPQKKVKKKKKSTKKKSVSKKKKGKKSDKDKKKKAKKKSAKKSPKKATSKKSPKKKSKSTKSKKVAKKKSTPK